MSYTISYKISLNMFTYFSVLFIMFYSLKIYRTQYNNIVLLRLVVGNRLNIFHYEF
jgi:hypothetical protein